MPRRWDEAEAARSQAEITCQEAKEAYEDKKASQPKMPEYSDYSSSAAGDFVTDGASEETQDLTDQASADASSAGSTVDTSAIENAIEQATSDLADLQSDPCFPEIHCRGGFCQPYRRRERKNACQQQSY